ncbi:MAG: hypothetical protein SF052_27220 [Bacteroidia bacterium]|nr:hypothetical protein [Bacteroidia bacterium]
MILFFLGGFLGCVRFANSNSFSITEAAENTFCVPGLRGSLVTGATNRIIYRGAMGESSPERAAPKGDGYS